MDKLDGVLNGDDVAIPVIVDDIDHRGQGRGLPASGRPRHENETPLLQGNAFEHRREMKIFQSLDLVGHDSEGDPELTSLLEDIDPESSQTVDLIAHIHFPILDEPLLLPVVHQTEGHLRHIIMIEGLQLIPGSSRSPLTLKIGGAPYLDVNIGGFLGKGFHQDLI